MPDIIPAGRERTNFVIRILHICVFSTIQNEMQYTFFESLVIFKVFLAVKFEGRQTRQSKKFLFCCFQQKFR